MKSPLKTVKAIEDCEDLYRIFEECPLLETRKECLAAILERNFSTKWLLDQMEGFLRILDLRGFFLVLQQIGPFLESFGYSTQEKIFNLLIRVSEEILERNDFGTNYLRKALLAMCSLIEYDRNFYNAQVRKLFTSILEIYQYPFSLYSPKLAKSLEIIYCLIALTKDKAMVPFLKKHNNNGDYTRFLLNKLSDPYNLELLEAMEAEKIAKKELGIIEQ